MGVAFFGLTYAKDVQDVKDSFPEECENDGLFTDLKDYKKTKATEGILSVYRENKELFKDGILKNGDDFSVYLLKKILLEGKTTNDINKDLENDLREDFKEKFKQKYPEKKYLGKNTIRNAFGIKRLAQGCYSSFLQTIAEFNKWFKECCIEAQKNRRVIETPEQRKARIEQIRQRNIERWESLSPEQQAKVIENLNKGWKSYNGANPLKSLEKDPEFKKQKIKTIEDMYKGANLLDEQKDVLDNLGYKKFKKTTNIEAMAKSIENIEKQYKDAFLEYFWTPERKQEYLKVLSAKNAKKPDLTDDVYEALLDWKFSDQV